MKAVSLLNKTYDGESIVDLSRDIDESIALIPNDEHGFQQGTFYVTITWSDYSE